MPNLLIWLVVLPPIELLVERTSPLSWRNVTTNLAILPIFLLGGYLEGKWKWNDLEKKFSVRC